MAGTGSFAVGILMGLLAGLVNGIFLLPMRYTRKWEWENVWLCFSILSTVAAPWIAACVAVPHLGDVFRSVPFSAFVPGLLAGLVWGVGQVMYGLSCGMVGIAIGSAAISCTAIISGILGPMIVYAPSKLLSSSSLVLLIATLVATYKCGLRDENRQARSNFALADVFGVDYESEERKYAHEETAGHAAGDYTSIYLESAGHHLAAMLAASTVGTPGTFLKLKRTTSEEVMRYRLPFMVEDMPHNHWFNWGPPPPGTESGGTAVAYNRFGKGQCIYLGVPLFRAMQFRPYWIKAWVPDLMRQLVREPIAEVRPEPFTQYLHGTFFYDKTAKHILVQVLNTVEAAMEGEYRGIPRVRINVDGKRLKVTGARMVWPTERELEVHSQSGRIELVIQNPPRYAAILLKLAGA
jgi:hypothetical protein